jgi:hypothetical protein
MFLAGTVAATICGQRSAFSQRDPLAILLHEVASDPTTVEAGWLFGETTVSRGVGKGTPSQRELSPTAKDLIIAFEVASIAAYEARYRKPIWPKGESGVTIGVGYDLKFANRSYIDRDWPMLPQTDRDLLYDVVGLSGTDAQQALADVSAVDIPWAFANKQFLAFLPYPTNDTESVFPNCDALSDDSFGALVSLVYNRGAAIGKNSHRRREMYEIQQLMSARKFVDIPGRIRSMKRLWENDPDARGLVKRREAEALLFERGIQKS